MHLSIVVLTFFYYLHITFKEVCCSYFSQLAPAAGSIQTNHRWPYSLELLLHIIRQPSLPPQPGLCAQLSRYLSFTGLQSVPAEGLPAAEAASDGDGPAVSQDAAGAEA